VPKLCLIAHPYKASGQVAGQGQYYSLSAPGSFGPSVNMPTAVPPLNPGFRLIYGNPTQSQTISQPTGTTLSVVGTFNLSQATTTLAGKTITGNLSATKPGG
jgi:hypothetical protein